jgi:4-hydroxymandelate oxidase
MDQVEAAARQVMGEMAYAYYSGGAEEELLVKENINAWKRWQLFPRVLRDVSRISTRTTVLGDHVEMPILIAPTAIQRLATPEGECATARGAARAGTVMTLSSLSNTPLREVATAGGGAPQWMQIYILKDRGRTKATVEQVVEAGYRALALTVDAPVSGLRSSELRGGVHLPNDLELPNLADEQSAHAQSQGFMAVVSREFDPSITFDDVTWLAEISGLPVVVKGVARGDDAVECINAGAAGVVVSNHGGRQLDDAPATASVLPEIVQALGGSGEVFVDGGVRKPADVVKALSLGARAVLLGRPILWALAAGGEDGVVDLLTWFAHELRRTMALCGAASISDIDESLTRPAP